MAYIGHEFYYDGTRATFFGYICTALINMGWELHDNISSTVKVYRSNGESGNEPYGYLWIDAGTSSYIQFCIYQHWDNSAHSGVRPRWAGNAPTACRINNFYTQLPAIIAGDKNLVVVLASSKNQGAIHGFFCGHACRVGVIVNAQGTAGTAGTLTVATTAGLGIGMKLQILSPEGYTDNVHITDIVDSSTVIVNKLAVNYGTGSKIGSPASVFGVSMGPSYYYNFYPVSGWGDSGTSGTSSMYYTIGQVSSYLNSSILFNEQQAVLARYIVGYFAATVPGVLVGFVSENHLQGISTNDWDAVVANNDGSFATAVASQWGTASSNGSAGSAVFFDSGKAWNADELSGKFCVITGGSGTAAGVIKKITGNDATSFVVDSNWVVPPVSGSTYILVDVVRRYMIYNLGNNLLTSTAPPS